MKNNFLFKIVKKGIVPSLAHSIAIDEEVVEHVRACLKDITHTFNALTTFNSQKPGAIVAALIEDEIYTEVVVGRIHVHPKVVNLLFLYGLS